MRILIFSIDHVYAKNKKLINKIIEISKMINRIFIT
jgi:hypothetical protein